MNINRFNPHKVFFHADRLAMIKDGIVPNPVVWTVYPTNDCPYSCKHCIMREERTSNQKTLSDKTMNRIVDDAYKQSVKTVIFSGGGEPLMHPLTLDMCRVLKNRGIKTGLNTNGFLLPKDLSMVDYLRVSIDAADSATYCEVHGVSNEAWNKTISNLKNIEKPPTELGLAFLITPDNWTQVFAFCEWAQQFNPDFIQIRPAYLEANYLSGGAEMRQICESVNRIKSVITETFDNVYISTDKLEMFWRQKQYTQCSASMLKAVLAADGQFVVCQDNLIRFGDYNNNDFSDIWGSAAHIQAINDVNLDKCPRCVEFKTNELIESCVINDEMRMNLL